jgi:hypothetical protein
MKGLRRKTDAMCTIAGIIILHFLNSFFPEKNRDRLCVQNYKNSQQKKSRLISGIST